MLFLSHCSYLCALPPCWPSGQGVRLESGRSRVRIPLAPGFFQGRVIPVSSKLAFQWLPFQAPDVIGLALGLVGLVSVYCDWEGFSLSLSVYLSTPLSPPPPPPFCLFLPLCLSVCLSVFSSLFLSMSLCLSLRLRLRH